jgi:cytochrome bd-type quinol oxidase subunit 2
MIPPNVKVLYFVTDMIWISLVPTCVRSPATIIQHHIATLLYLVVPYSKPQFLWCMGACMSVEINTWFLIARRVFNKQEFLPWVIGLPPFVSIRVELISIFFYLTWISIRCILYPYLLVEFAHMWNSYSIQAGTRLNVLAIVLPLHVIFCLLNVKWTYDLIMSKLRYWRRKGKKEPCKGLSRTTTANTRT